MPVIPIAVGFILVSGLAYALKEKKQAKPSLRREKRGHRRQNLYAHALVKKEGTEFEFSGEIGNISDRGAYLTTNGLFSPDDLLDLTIYFQHGTKKISMTVPCKVARIDGKGVGLSSTHIDAGIVQHLELLFDASKENTQQLIEEFIKVVSSL